MKAFNENELREQLASFDTPEPPAGLAERIKAEIPGDLVFPAEPATSNVVPFRRRLAPRERWLIAAGLAVAVAGGSYLTLRLERTAEPAMQVAEADRVPAPPPAPVAAPPPPPGEELRRITPRPPSAPSAQPPAPPPFAEQKARPLTEMETLRAAAKQLRDAQPAAKMAPPVEVGGATSRQVISSAETGEPSGEFHDEITIDSTFVTIHETRASGSTYSTGGSAEPNDAPYGDVFFEGHGTNPFIDTEDDNLSTFGLDVDTASYTVMRRYLQGGNLPPADAVRIEELINYFDYRDAPPEKSDFALRAEGAPSPWGEGAGYYLLRFNLRGREVAAEDRPPANLTFVVDVSGSMAQENRLGMVKQALRLLLDQLRPEDRVGLVIYGSTGEVVLEQTNDHEAIGRAIERLVPSGSTNAEEGLRLGYQMAARNFRKGAIHRVILCSDGVANVGRTGPESILAEIRHEADKGIELTTVGFGMGNYNDVLMEQLADSGNGRYAYVDELDEARRIFVENLTGTLHTIAAEARVQVEFNPRTVRRYRLVGYENRDIADERFRDDTVDAGEIGAGHSVTALYEVKLREGLRPSDEIATLRLRWASAAKGEMVETALRVIARDFVASWEKASPALRLTSLVAEFGEILKGSYWAKKGDLGEVFRRTQAVAAEFPGDVEVAELATLMGQAARLKQESTPQR